MTQRRNGERDEGQGRDKTAAWQQQEEQRYGAQQRGQFVQRFEIFRETAFDEIQIGIDVFATGLCGIHCAGLQLVHLHLAYVQRTRLLAAVIAQMPVRAAEPYHDQYDAERPEQRFAGLKQGDHGRSVAASAGEDKKGWGQSML